MRSIKENARFVNDPTDEGKTKRKYNKLQKKRIVDTDVTDVSSSSEDDHGGECNIVQICATYNVVQGEWNMSWN